MQADSQSKTLQTHRHVGRNTSHAYNWDEVIKLYIKLCDPETRFQLCYVGYPSEFTPLE